MIRADIEGAKMPRIVARNLLDRSANSFPECAVQKEFFVAKATELPILDLFVFVEEQFSILIISFVYGAALVSMQTCSVGCESK